MSIYDLFVGMQYALPVAIVIFRIWKWSANLHFLSSITDFLSIHLPLPPSHH